MAATTRNSLLTAEPHRVHTLGDLSALVQHQADCYLACEPYRVPSDACFWRLMDRLMELPRAKNFKQGKAKERASNSSSRPQLTRTMSEEQTLRPQPNRTRNQETSTRPQSNRTRSEEGTQRPRPNRTRSEEGVQRPRPRPQPENRRPREGNEAHTRGNDARREMSGRRGHGLRQRTAVTREETHERTKTEMTNPPEFALAFPGVIHEDTLLALNSNLTYRIRCIKQATRYKDLLVAMSPGCKAEDFLDCENDDLGGHLQYELNRPGPGPNMKKIALERIMGSIDEAKLFEIPASGGKEEKAVIYVALSITQVVGWIEACNDISKLVDRLVKKLAAKRHEVLEGNIHHPTFWTQYQGPPRKDQTSLPQLSKSVATIVDSPMVPTPTMIIRGGFGRD